MSIQACIKYFPERNLVQIYDPTEQMWTSLISIHDLAGELARMERQLAPMPVKVNLTTKLVDEWLKHNKPTKKVREPKPQPFADLDLGLTI